MIIAIEKISTRDKKGKLVIFEAGKEIKGIDDKDKQRLIELNVAYSTDTEEIIKKRKRNQFVKRINKVNEEYYYV